MDNFSDGLYPTPEREWEPAKTIVETKSFAKQIESFTKEAEKVPAYLRVDRKRKVPRPSETSNDQKGNALLYLWRYYFRAEAWIGSETVLAMRGLVRRCNTQQVGRPLFCGV